MRRYTGVGHLGPFEAPARIAGRVLLNFMYTESPQTWEAIPKRRLVVCPSSRL